MKASPEHQRVLLELQQLDTSLARVDRKQSQLPEHAALEALVAETPELKRAYMDAQRSLEDLALEQQRLDSDLALIKERLHRDETKLDASVSGKEAAALQHEIETVNHRAAQLEDMQFQLLERREELDAAFEEAERALRDHERVRVETSKNRDARLAELDHERTELLEARDALKRGISDELYELYEETRQRYGIGAAMLRGRISEGSNMALTDSDLAEIRETPDDEIVFCRDSGCILVRTNESAL